MLADAVSLIYERLYYLNKGVHIKQKPSIFVNVEIDRGRYGYDWANVYSEMYKIPFPDMRVFPKITIRFGFEKSESKKHLLLTGKDSISILFEFKSFLKIANKVCNKVVLNRPYLLDNEVKKAYKRHYLEAYKKGFNNAERFSIDKIKEEFFELTEEMYANFSDLYIKSKDPDFRRKLKNMDTEGKSYFNFLPSTKEDAENWKVIADIISLHQKIKSFVHEKST
jgi:hypothetical protein